VTAVSAGTSDPVDAVHRRVCHALFDALERADVDAVDQLYAPEMTMWFNVSGSEISRADNLAAIRSGAERHRRRTYDDRQVHTFSDGFLAQYTCRVVAHDGTTVPLSACLVGTVHEGRIVHLAEYLDSGRFRRP
jgi:ketosteroid isomerase-like protein